MTILNVIGIPKLIVIDMNMKQNTCEVGIAKIREYSTVEIRIAYPSDHENITNFLNKFFYKDEPLNKYLKSTFGNYSENGNVRQFCEGELMDPTVVALAEGNIIGVCLNRILIKGVDESELYTSENVVRQKLLDFLKYVEDKSKYFDYFPSGVKGMTVDLISVDNAFRGRGIAKKLLIKTREVAREKQCGFIVITCTSQYSSAAVESLGYKKIYSLKYEDYIVNGKVVFKPEPPHEEIKVYIQDVL